MGVASRLLFALTFAAGTAGFMGCSGTPDQQDPNAASEDDLSADVAESPEDIAYDNEEASPNAGPTWSALYTQYFAKGTIGHCGNVGCHSIKRGGFKCGKTKTSCYSGLVAAKLISTSNPSSSKLISSTTPLSWFGTGGPMPKDQKQTNQAAADAVTAWVKAGALKN